MANNYTKEIKPLVASLLYDALAVEVPAARLPSTAYVVGDQVINGITTYVATVAGTTGTGAGPTSTTGSSSDGSVTWLAIGTNRYIPGQIDSNFYLSIGKNASSEWSDPSNADIPDISLSGEKDVLKSAIAFLKVEPSDITTGIKNNPWTSGQIYDQYDPSKDIYSRPHYAIVNDKDVYLCVDNSGDVASTQQPSDTSTALLETADGYIWKYVGSISSLEFNKFGTDVFVPTPAPSVTSPIIGQIASFNGFVGGPELINQGDAISVQVQGDGAGATAAARIKSSTMTNIFATSGGAGYTDAYAIAKLSSATGSGAGCTATISNGKITAITVDQTGSGYTNALVLVYGDGQGARAAGTITGGQLTSVAVSSAGDGYTWARVFVIPGTKGGVARAVLSPYGGLGYQLSTQLEEKYLIVSKTLTSDLDDYIPTTGDSTFRQVSLVSNVSGSLRNAPAFIGPEHPDYSNTSATQIKYTSGTGSVHYINNFPAVTHSSTQEEVIKIAISL